MTIDVSQNGEILQRSPLDLASVASKEGKSNGKSRRF